ncbi:hypothetical protein [Glycomyces sp. NPDC048151]|uniref:CdiA C-terminal domain-containing protein n=1 Tax=Glycomyces sp. NPDC048151 TaxID=3364002 RepID=UPI0037224FD8
MGKKDGDGITPGNGDNTIDPNTGKPKSDEQRKQDMTYDGMNAGEDFDGVMKAGDQNSQDGRHEGGSTDPTSEDAPDSDGGTDNTSPSQTPDPNNTPRGEPTEVNGSPSNRRSLERENESAQTLAENGYDVEQNPPGKDNGKNPDYKIEGEYFDCYAPSRDDAGRIRDDISRKVKKDQAERIILNLDDSGLNPADLRSVLERRPVGNLQEVKIIKDGQVIDFFPF